MKYPQTGPPDIGLLADALGLNEQSEKKGLQKVYERSRSDRHERDWLEQLALVRAYSLKTPELGADSGQIVTETARQWIAAEGDLRKWERQRVVTRHPFPNGAVRKQYKRWNTTQSWKVEDGKDDPYYVHFSVDPRKTLIFSSVTAEGADAAFVAAHTTLYLLQGLVHKHGRFTIVEDSIGCPLSGALCYPTPQDAASISNPPPKAATIQSKSHLHAILDTAKSAEDSRLGINKGEIQMLVGPQESDFIATEITPEPHHQWMNPARNAMLIGPERILVNPHMDRHGHLRFTHLTPNRRINFTVEQ
jgi:hypothetical protein